MNAAWRVFTTQLSYGDWRRYTETFDLVEDLVIICESLATDTAPLLSLTR